MADASVDWVFADPPYNVGLAYDVHDDRMERGAYRDWCRAWYSECRRVSRSCVVITPAIVNVPMWLADIERTHFILAWTKQNNQSRNYIGPTSGFQTWEPILVYGKAKRCVLRDSVDVPIAIQGGIDHPCPKPLKLMRWLVEQFTELGDTVLDPFCGSGTTGIAAVRAGRQFIGIEKSPVYAAEAKRRIGAALAEPQLDGLVAVR